MSLTTTYTKAETNYLIQQLEKKTASGYRGDLNKTDPAPTTVGFYGLTEVGIYPNLGNINAEEGKLNFASFDGSVWSLVGVTMPKGDDGKTIENWIAKAYIAGSSVYYEDNKIYLCESNTIASDVPGQSSKWKIKIDISDLQKKAYPILVYPQISEMYLASGFDINKQYKIDLLVFDDANYKTYARILNEDNSEVATFTGMEKNTNGVYYGKSGSYEIYFSNPSKTGINNIKYLINNDFAFDLSKNKNISLTLSQNPMFGFYKMTEIYLGAGFSKIKQYKIDLLVFDDATYGTYIRVLNEDDSQVATFFNVPQTNGVYHAKSGSYEFWFVNPSKTGINNIKYLINNDFAFDLSKNKNISLTLFPNGISQYNFNDYELHGLGDSITHGYNDINGSIPPVGHSGNTPMGYLERLYFKLKLKSFYKHAYTGTSCKYNPSRSRLKDQVNAIPISSSKKIITLMIGTNDMLDGYDNDVAFTNDMNNLQTLLNKNISQLTDTNSFVEAFYFNLLTILKNHKGNKIFVLDITNGSFDNDRLVKVRNMQKTICKHLGVPFIEFDSYFTKSESYIDGYTTTDGVHPSPEIHEIMSTNLIAKLSPYFLTF